MNINTRFTMFAMVMLFVLCAANASAEKLYRSRGENGTLIFSDRPVANAQILAVQRVEVAKQACFGISERGSKQDLRLYGVNDCYGPVAFRFVMKESRNVSWNRSHSYETVVPARKTQSLVHLWQRNKYSGCKYTYSTSFVPGDPKARHHPPAPYLLPVPSGRFYRISQAFHGEFSHTHPQSIYAVDIAMPQGTPIHAARAGVIMEVANDFFTGGVDDSFAQKANYIRILHDDGTMALYAHLRTESIRYPAGTRVARGQVIAESGNTGYSSGPHLHFVIQKNTGMELRSIPFEFADSGGNPFTPEKGRYARR